MVVMIYIYTLCIFNYSEGAFSFHMLLAFVGDSFYSTILQYLHLRGGQGGSYTDIYDENCISNKLLQDILLKK